MGFEKFTKFVKIILFFWAKERMFDYLYDYLLGKMKKVYKKIIIVICKKERGSLFLLKISSIFRGKMKYP